MEKNHREVWQYNFYPKDPFTQVGTDEVPVVYWLQVWAMVPLSDAQERFGWKTSLTHYNDDAVTWANPGDYWIELNYPAEHPFYQVPGSDSMDMAFVITTPEPATLSLLLMGCVALSRLRKRT